MSDYLGPNQTRVLDPENRSFEEVVYQKRKPPLSSEATFAGRLASENARASMASLVPSGWLVSGNIFDSVAESACFSGDVLCSPGFAANSFKVIAADRGVMRGRLVAMVNGWKILVQGSTPGSSMDALESNHIILPTAPLTDFEVNFVFLEVWRNLVGPTDTIYKYGNIYYGGANPSNDLIDPATNFETSLRVQLRYRIRVVSTVRVNSYPEGFDPTYVFAQGSKTTPQNCSYCTFIRSESDTGLWVAGLGDDSSKEALGTVDGYVYALPMFFISRRNRTTYQPDNNANGTQYARADYLVGRSSERPDGLYSDIIAGDDILDLRHTVGSVKSDEEICKEWFRKLIAGNFKTKMEQTTLGGTHIGSVLTQVDAISVTDTNGSQGIGVNGDSTRHIFVNALIDQPETFVRKTVDDKTLGTVGGAWAAGNKVTIAATGPVGSVVKSIERAYSADDPLVTLANSITVGTVPATSVDLTISGLLLPGSMKSITIEYTLQYPQGPYGLNYLPTNFYESGSINWSLSGGNSFALKDNDIPVRGVMGEIYDADTTGHHMLMNRGRSDTSNWNFGHQLLYYPTSTGPTFTVPRDLFGYDILGLANVTVNGADSIGVQSVSRTSSLYTVTMNTTGRFGVSLYTSGIHFDASVQGRGITGTYEMVEMSPVSGAGTGVSPYVLDSTNQLMLALACLSQDAEDSYCYVSDVMKRSVDGYHAKNTLMPDTTRTRTTVWFDAPVPVASTVKVPVLRNAAISVGAGQKIVYRRLPYQGLLDTTSVTGNVRAEGPAIITTAGSGSVVRQTTSLTNIIDRLPAGDADKDGLGIYTAIAISGMSSNPTLETKPTSRVQDIMGTLPGIAVIGYGSADRGRSGVVLPGMPLSGTDGKPYLGLRMGSMSTTPVSYQKTYQSYLLDKDCSGELYLMVVGSESDNTTSGKLFTYYSGNDSVDIYRMPGRPLRK